MKTALEKGMISLGTDDSGLVTDDECIKAIEIALKDFAEKIENEFEKQIPLDMKKYTLEEIGEILKQLKKQEGIEIENGRL